MTNANWLQKAVINNFIWSAFQRKRIVPVWQSMAEVPADAQLLEVGCGRGAGSIILFDVFKPRRIDAFDVDEDMVRKARKLLQEEFNGRINVGVGDVTDISAADASYDAVFDFFTLGNVEDWYSGILEISRVLKPGGCFAFAELYSSSVARSIILRTMFPQPAGIRLDRGEFVRALAENGLRIMEKRASLWGYGIVGAAKKNTQ